MQRHNSALALGERRAPGETSTHMQAAGSRMESEGGSCPMNGGEPHQFRYGKCRLCGKAEAADLLKDDGVKKTCPHCAHRWLDRYNKGECPKCLQELTVSGPRRLPGETSTHRQAAGSRMESTSGVCPKNNGEAHVFRYGKCRFCGKAEGTTHAYQGGECAKGGRHIFHFGKCSKCGVAENHLVSAAAKERSKDGAADAPGDATAETPAMAAARASRLVSAREGGGGAPDGFAAEQLSLAGRASPAQLRFGPSDDEIVKLFREIRKLPPAADVGHPAGPTALEALADGLPAPKAAVVGAAPSRRDAHRRGELELHRRRRRQRREEPHDG